MPVEIAEMRRVKAGKGPSSPDAQFSVSCGERDSSLWVAVP